MANTFALKSKRIPVHIMANRVFLHWSKDGILYELNVCQTYLVLYLLDRSRMRKFQLPCIMYVDMKKNVSGMQNKKIRRKEPNWLFCTLEKMKFYYFKLISQQRRELPLPHLQTETLTTIKQIYEKYDGRNWFDYYFVNEINT